MEMMTDFIWPPKNPREVGDPITLSNFFMRIGWQEGHEDTMEALRPVLEETAWFLTLTKIWGERISQLKAQIEQILKEDSA